MERRVLRKTAVDICASCKNQGQQGCKKSEIDSSKDGKVTLLICMTERLGEVRLGQKNIFEYCSATEPELKPEPEPKQELKNSWKGFFEAVTPEPGIQKEQKKSVLTPTIQTIECTDAPFKNWDETYTRLLHCIKDHHTIGSMSKVLNLPRSTIRDRLTKLEKKEIITKSETTLLGNRCANFIITSGWAMKLVNHDEPQIIVNKPQSQQRKPEPVKFTRHNVSLQAEIITGTIPKGDKRYSPNGWTGEIFEGNGTYKIRVIPNRKGTARAVIDIFVSLGASSTADLTMKYHAFAERYLGAWAEKHILKLGQITEYRTPHTVIEGSKGLAQTILKATGGETKIADMGVQVDESDKEHKGEVEFHGTKKEESNKGAESLRNFEFALNQSPEKMEQLASKFDALRDTLHNEVEKVGNGLSGIQGFLILQRENDLLREQVQLYREQMTELTKQVNEMKVMLGLLPAHPGSKKNKYDEVGIYG